MLRRLLTRVSLLVAALLLTLAGAGVGTICAQTLARPGWTGSGMNSEPWWRSAVFYRIAPEHFQDSDGDGVGDLGGVAQRLDYLRTLGVDAIVLQLPFDDAGFDDLLAEASRRHVRLVIGLDRGAGPAADGPGQTLVAVASHWLTRGAAGILLPAAPAPAEALDPAEQMRRDVAESLLVLALRRAAAQMPGERVVIPTAEPASAAKPEQRAEATQASRPSARAVRPGAPQLVLSTLPLHESGTVTVSSVAAALTGAMPGDGVPLLQLQAAGGSSTGAAGAIKQGVAGGDAALRADAEIAAAALLTQRSAVMLEYGQELGTPAPERMPWTPTNVTPAPGPPPGAAKPPAPPAEIVYGPYRPYVPPPPKPKPPQPPAPGESIVPDLDMLPGFSTKAAPDREHSEALPSVVLQERDPQSLLNLYRRLSALHHGNATLRSGDLEVLHEGDGAEDDTVAWLRRAPSGARTVAAVVVAVNCGDRPATLSLGSDFTRLHLGPFALRSLLFGGQLMGSTELLLAPHAVFVGELAPDR